MEQFPLLNIYVAALCFGGAFLLLSVMTGSDEAAEAADAGADADFDADADLGDFDADVADYADVDVDADADLDADAPDHGPDHVHDLADSHAAHTVTVAGSLVWFPFGSIRYWIFFLTFGGLTGTLLELTGAAAPSSLGILGAAVMMGYVTGTTAVNVLRYARRSDSTSGMTVREMIGLEARVLLPVGKSRPGKVRIQTRSGSEDFPALAQESGRSFERDARVVVVGFRGNRAIVREPDEARA